MAYIDAQVTDLVGGTIDQDACNQWAVDGAREIIMQLPAPLQERCSDFSLLNASPTTLDLDTAANAKVGRVLYCTRYNGTYHIPCRLVSSANADLTSDSNSSNHYAVADDPAYYISDNTVVIKPTTDGTYVGRVYHIVYPTSLDISAVTAGDMTNFPIECEHLLVLYIAIKQLLQYQSTMSSSWDTDINNALSKVTAALGKMDTHTWDNEETFLTANSQITRVKDALDKVSLLIEGNKPASSYDAHDLLQTEDLELMSGTLSIAQMEIGRAQAHLGEWSAIGSMAIQDANGSTAEANARLQQDVTKYQWYGDQYVRLSAEYVRGLAGIKVQPTGGA